MAEDNRREGGGLPGCYESGSIESGDQSDFRASRSRPGDDGTAAIVKMPWGHSDCFSITHADRIFSLVIDKGHHVLLKSDQKKNEYVQGRGGESTQDGRSRR